MPAYCQSNDALARSGLSDSKSRLENEAARLEKRCENFLKTDMVENFDDLITKIDEDMNRQEYKMYQTQLGVNFVHLTVILKKILKLPFFVVNKLSLHLLTLTFCHQTKSVCCCKFPI